MTKEERWIDGRLDTTEWAYDAADRVTWIKYPDGEELTYSYAANGLLGQIASALAPSPLLSGVEYNVLDMPIRYVLGSGTTAEVRHAYFWLDPGAEETAPYGALRTIQLQRGTNPMLVNRELGYDRGGNVTRVGDNVNGESIVYGYDELDRLLSAGAPLNESYTYSADGNIATRNGTQYVYHPMHKHAVCSYDGVSYTYDDNGCMTSPGNQTIRHDPENRPLRIDIPTSRSAASPMTAMECGGNAWTTAAPFTTSAPTPTASSSRP